MPAPLITALPLAPSRADDGATFSTKADAFVAALPEFVSDANAQAAYLNDLTEAAFAAGLEDAAANAAIAASGANTASAAELSATNSATSANASKEQSAASAASASASLAATLASAGLSGAKAYASRALAVADFANQTNNQVVFIAVDESNGNQGTYNRASGTPVTSLVFLRFHEYYTSPTAAVASDSVQNTLTKLLVATGMIPAASPSLTLGV